MRINEILSKPISDNFELIEEFINSPLKIGKIRKINAGSVNRIYFCKKCNLPSSFVSMDDIHCILVNNRMLSISTTLKCTGCDETIPMWFLVESQKPFNETTYHNVRLLLAIEKLSENVSLNTGNYGKFTDLLEKADISFRNQLGSAAMIYLRKIFEGITHQIANAEGIETHKDNGDLKPFREILEKVDEKHRIIPNEFRQNRYLLFRELSNIVHNGNIENEDVALNKYPALKRLIIGILDKVKNDEEIMEAIGTLGWDQEGGTNEQN